MNQQRIDLLLKYIEEEPNNPFNRYALAMEYFDNDPEQSIGLLDELTKTDPEYLPSYYKLAHLYWEKEEAILAKQTFMSGIALAEKSKDDKALKELKAAYLNFQFETD